jgi:hypothetical protein
MRQAAGPLLESSTGWMVVAVVLPSCRISTASGAPFLDCRYEITVGVPWKW